MRRILEFMILREPINNWSNQNLKKCTCLFWKDTYRFTSKHGDTGHFIQRCHRILEWNELTIPKLVLLVKFPDIWQYVRWLKILAAKP